MRARLIPLLALGVVVGASASPPLRAQGTSVCLPADNQTVFLGAVLTKFLTGTDAMNVGLRQRLDLPQVTASSISLITDTRTCDEAVPALNAAQAQSATRRLYVFKLGNSRFGVVEQAGAPTPGVYGGGSTSVCYFDSKWAYVSTGEL
jgi:hypothetical protein